MSEVPGDSSGDRPGTGADNWVERSLRGLPRTEPPDVPLESIFERWHARRRRAAVFSGLALAASLLALVLVRPVADDAPVHLKLKVVDVPLAEVLGDVDEEDAP